MQTRTFQREQEVVERIRVLLVRLRIVLLVVLVDGDADDLDGPLRTLLDMSPHPNSAATHVEV